MAEFTNLGKFTLKGLVKKKKSKRSSNNSVKRTDSNGEL